MNQLNGMCERVILDDILSSQKMITGLYNTSANECAAPVIRDEFLSILSEEHQMQAEVFDEMQKRGWYPVPAAEQQKIAQAKEKFQNANPGK